MKSKNVVRIITLTLFLFFLCVYIAQATGYYEVDMYRKTALTNEAMSRFEKDVKDGKILKAKEYLEPDKQYRNAFNRIGMKSSIMIEKAFNKIMKYLFKEMGDAIDK